VSYHWTTSQQGNSLYEEKPLIVNRPKLALWPSVIVALSCSLELSGYTILQVRTLFADS